MNRFRHKKGIVCKLSVDTQMNLYLYKYKLDDEQAINQKSVLEYLDIKSQKVPLLIHTIHKQKGRMRKGKKKKNRKKSSREANTCLKIRRGCMHFEPIYIRRSF